jgi:hypothetical protein
MMRSLWIYLAAAAVAANAFSLVPSSSLAAARSRTRHCPPLGSAVTPDEDDSVPPPPSFLMQQDSDKAATAISSSAKDMVQDTLAMVTEKLKEVDMDQVKETVATTWETVTTKAQEFAQDEQVQEFVAKAKEFAQNALEQVLALVREKFNDWKDSQAVDEGSTVAWPSNDVDVTVENDDADADTLM